MAWALSSPPWITPEADRLAAAWPAQWPPLSEAKTSAGTSRMPMRLSSITVASPRVTVSPEPKTGWPSWSKLPWIAPAFRAEET